MFSAANSSESWLSSCVYFCCLLPLTCCIPTWQPTVVLLMTGRFQSWNILASYVGGWCVEPMRGSTYISHTSTETWGPLSQRLYRLDCHTLPRHFWSRDSDVLIFADRRVYAHHDFFTTVSASYLHGAEYVIENCSCQQPRRNVQLVMRARAEYETRTPKSMWTVTVLTFQRQIRRDVIIRRAINFTGAALMLPCIRNVEFGLCRAYGGHAVIVGSIYCSSIREAFSLVFVVHHYAVPSCVSWIYYADFFRY